MRISHCRALGKLTEDFAESTGIEVGLDLRVLSDVHLTPETSQALYRTVQEGLTNVQRHAGARSAQVRLVAPNGTVVLHVEDDGVGPSAHPPQTEAGGYGLIGLRERVALLGGILEFGPGHAGGACLSVTLPVEVSR